MRILVTGGAGYIGSVLTPLLLGGKHKVTIIDNFMYNQTPLLDCCSNKNLNMIRGDARDQDLIKEEIKRADVILPLACLTGAPICDNDPVGAKTINFEAIKLLLKLRSKNQIIIFPSSQSVYGHQEEVCTEKTQVKPLSLYSKLKVKAEEAISESENFIIFRFATVFGISPRMRLDLLVNDFTYRAVNDKFIILFEANFKRDFLHVGDAARAFIFCIENFRKLKNTLYNVKLEGANLTKKELCSEIKKQLPDFVYEVSNIRSDPDRRDYLVSADKFKNAGYNAKTSIRDGINELIRGYQIIKRNQFSNI